MSYSQLTYEQRYLIYELLKTGYTQTKIARSIGVHKSTVSRELKRNSGKRGYRYQQAQRRAERRKRKAKRRITPGDWLIIERYLRKDFSPEQTAQWVLKHFGIQVSPEWIYQHIWEDKRNGGQLYQHLRRKKKYRKRGANGDNRGKIPRQRSIEERPAIVDGRERIGDWEADTIIGKGMKGAIVTLVDRKSRFLRMGLVEQRTKETIKESMIELLKGYPVHTITCDNGKEFAAHEEIAQALEADIYFAHPYSSWERGTNENTNGLIRQYFPKDADFRMLTDMDISFVEYRLNTRPRKCLSFSPPMVFLKNHCCT
jgi:transposase, IS30 family